VRKICYNEFNYIELNIIERNRETVMVKDDAGAVQAADNWCKLLAELKVGYLVFDQSADREMVEQFKAHPDWAVDFEDDEAACFVSAGRGRKERRL
jgi:hypothetical protein